MEEILHHLFPTEPYETWDILHIDWCSRILSYLFNWLRINKNNEDDVVLTSFMWFEAWDDEVSSIF